MTRSNRTSLEHRCRSRSAGLVELAALLAVSALLAGCVTAPTVATPEGFASYPEADAPLAVSPEGVGFRVRTVANEPPQELAFWAEALSRHMVDSGYLPYARESFSSPAGTGVAFEWMAPVGADDWVYLTAIVVTDETILIAEAAGPASIYEQHREAVRAALETIASGDAKGEP